MQYQWEWESCEGIKYLTLPGWKARGVILSFSSRSGGVSHKPYDSLNLSLQVCDKQEDVLTNRMMLVEAVGGELQDVVCCEQVNGHQVAVVGKTDKVRGVLQHSDAIPGCDAMITNTPGVFLMVTAADCLPIYFFDPVKRVIGLAHFGYNEKHGQIAWETAKRMVQDYRCNYWDIEVFIGPGLGKCCNMIDEKQAQQLKDTYPLANNIIYETDEGLRWDMVSANRQVLEILGVSPDNISTCDLCTFCHGEDFFSKRRDGRTGQMAAILSLTK